MRKHIYASFEKKIEVDEELFEDNPIEYIRRDLEGSGMESTNIIKKKREREKMCSKSIKIYTYKDTDTRRRAAADFIRGLMERYESQTTQIITKYITYFLEVKKKKRKK